MANYLSCFRSSTISTDLEDPSTSPNITTSLYHTDLGVAAVTWSRRGRATHIDLRFDDTCLSFRFLFKPFLFWKKHGSKKLNLKNTSRRVEIFWDLSRAKFDSGPEPQSGFYLAAVVDGEMILLVGDCENEAYVKTKARRARQDLIFKREHVFGSELYEVRARFGGERRDIVIGCGVNDDDDDDEPVLGFSLDGKKILQVKRLEWKFRGDERVDVDGVRIHVAWDVYNWLFEDAIDAPAVFTFRFEKIGEEIGVLWEQISGLEMNELRKKKKRKNKSSCNPRTSWSSSSISSSASSGFNSSVMEWTSSEENELQSGATGLTLLVFAWRS